jgi:hypothetical protein
MLYQKIRKLYRELGPEDFRPFIGTIALRNDGDGDYIFAWNHPVYQRPTQQQLAAIVLDADSSVVPKAITSRQFRLYLRAIGRYNAAKNYIMNADEPTQIYFEYETVFRRNAPEIVAMAVNFNLTPEEMDDVFIAASKL